MANYQRALRKHFEKGINMNERLEALNSSSGQSDAYEIYKKIVSEIPEEAKTQIPYRSEVVADKTAEVKKKLGATASTEELAKAIEKAKYAQVSERQIALRENRMGGSITGLFKKMLEMETTGQGDMAKIAQENSWYMAVPEVRRLFAEVREDGYFWGGRFVSFAEQAVKDAEAKVLNSVGLDEHEIARMKIIEECGVARNAAWEEQSYPVLSGIDDVEALALEKNKIAYKED